MIKNAIYNAIIIQTRHRNHEKIHKMMRSDWFGWFRVADTKPYLNIACVLFMLFSAEMPYVRCFANVLTAIARSVGDTIYLRTSSMHVSERALCLIDLIWRYYWTVSSWTIDFDDNEKWSQGVFSERLRMNSNRSKTAYSRFCRVVCCLIGESRVLLDVRMTRFFL